MMPGGILFRKMCGDDDALRGQLVRDEYPSLGDHFMDQYFRENTECCVKVLLCCFPIMLFGLKQDHQTIFSVLMMLSLINYQTNNNPRKNNTYIDGNDGFS